MALIKSISTRFGIDATYWKIIDLNINWLSKNSHISLSGWSDKASRDAGNIPLDSRSFDWMGEDFPFIGEEPQNERETAYNKIKQSEEFADAEDLL